MDTNATSSLEEDLERFKLHGPKNWTPLCITDGKIGLQQKPKRKIQLKNYGKRIFIRVNFISMSLCNWKVLLLPINWDSGSQLSPQIHDTSGFHRSQHSLQVFWVLHHVKEIKTSQPFGVTSPTKCWDM